MRFGTWIRAHRLRHGLSMDNVCENVDLSKAYLSLIETGQKGPPKDEIVRQIARAMGLDENDLLMRAHRERYPEDVMELRQTIEDLRRTISAVRNGPSPLEKREGNGNGGNGDVPTPRGERLAETLNEALYRLERLVPNDAAGGELSGELDDLRAEERSFVLAMIRQMKSLRPRRGPQPSHDELFTPRSPLSNSMT